MKPEDQTRILAAGLDLVSTLVLLDPHPDTPEGVLLERVAAAVEDYEVQLFPGLTPWGGT